MSKYHSNRGYFGRQIPYTLHWYQSRGYFGRGNYGKYRGIMGILHLGVTVHIALSVDFYTFIYY